jgi:hypothetical protein
LTILFSAYHDGGTIASPAIAAAQVARPQTPDRELSLVNLGSGDNTGNIAVALARTFPDVRVDFRRPAHTAVGVGRLSTELVVDGVIQPW